MTFSKIRYGQGETIVKVKIEDDMGKFLEDWTFKMNDLHLWVRIMERKYGLKEKGDDLEWAKR